MHWRRFTTVTGALAGIVAVTVLTAVALARPAQTSRNHAAGGVAASSRLGSSTYRPPNIKPIIHPAVKKEGVWSSTGVWIHGGPPILVTKFRAERSHPRDWAYVAWIDSTRTQLALYPGLVNPPNARPRGPAEIPVGQRSRALAVFNSGFRWIDAPARYGFSVNGHVAQPMGHGYATIVGYRNGTVNVISWTGGHGTPSTVVLARQNLPLIVIGGKRNPKLSATEAWGFTLNHAVRVWRSGVGVDKHGNLIFLAAPDQTVITLANALIHAGCVRAMELDINPYWPTFNFYRKPGCKGICKYLPNPQASGVTRYLHPDHDDFFVVYRKSSKPGVPFK